MSAHTPGPWRWSPEGLRAVADGQLILSRPWNVDPSTPDALLIVAAPELYTALKALLASFEDGAAIDTADAYDEADAALAKAEGRP